MIAARFTRLAVRRRAVGPLFVSLIAIALAAVFSGCDTRSSVSSTFPADGDVVEPELRTVRVTYSSSFNSNQDENLTEPENILDDRVALNSGFEIVSTSVAIKMEGFLDTDLVRLAQAVTTGFPGQIALRTLSLHRRSAVTREGLIAISRGSPVVLVDGQLTFSWRTLRPLEQNANRNQ